MEKIYWKEIFLQTKELLMMPAEAWPKISRESNSAKALFRSFVLPQAIAMSVIVLLFSLFRYSVFFAFLNAVANVLALSCGIWVSYLIAREVLNNKIADADNIALKLTVYSTSVFTVFHSLAVAFGNGFFGQLLTIVSLIFIRTLYIGVNQTETLPANQRTNFMVIVCLSVICFTVIFNKILTVIFMIPVFNV